MPRNPFQQLYNGEKMAPKDYVQIFSNELIRHATPLFQPGHVVLTGVQGSGKSMLFKLLHPEIRVAFSEAKMDFPVGKESPLFVGAGINVNTSRCNDFGNRRIASEDGSARELMFGDFFNYVVCLDILRSVQTLADNQSTAEKFGLSGASGRWRAFVAEVSAHDAWEGYLRGSQDLEDLVARMRGRETLYRRFLNANDFSLDAGVGSTKTSAGEPMKAVVTALKHAGVVPRSIEFYVLVDQYEELAVIKDGGSGADYRGVVNKVLSRDATLSYRLGTRGYAWRDHVQVFGTSGALEQDRDYKLVDLDAMLRNAENRETSIFPPFARDVFRRRIGWSGGRSMPTGPDAIYKVLGRSLPPEEEAKRLAGEDRSAIITRDPGWPDEVDEALRELAEADPLSAKLGEVWIRQKGHGKDVLFERPWNAKSKQYWRKERIELALLQIGGKRKQRAILSGYEDVIGLSGGNILMFLSICQSVWDVAAPRDKVGDGAQPAFPIEAKYQTLGIFMSGKTWLDRIQSDYGRSNDRYNLVDMLGRHFATTLLTDLKMSNPGQNGVSFDLQELRSNPDVRSILIEAVDHGNLVMVEHTTRNKDRKRRLKFYLNPLYCPYYRIPYQHTKEPIYVSVEAFRDWLHRERILSRTVPPKPRKAGRSPSAAPLPDLFGDRGGA